MAMKSASFFRIDEEDLNTLKNTANHFNVTTSQLIRSAIKQIQRDLRHERQAEFDVFVEKYLDEGMEPLAAIRYAKKEFNETHEIKK